MKMEKISAENILFIKLGRGGDFEEKCIEEKTLKLGYSEVDDKLDELCKKGEWENIKKIFLESLFVVSRFMFSLELNWLKRLVSRSFSAGKFPKSL